MGIYFGANGQDVPTRLTERMVTLSAAQLRGIPEVIGIARGEAKAAAVMGAVRASMLKSLVIDTEIAHAMLAVDPRLTPLAR